MAREGEPVRYLRSTIVPTDESLLCLLEAPSDDLVRAVYARAGVPFERLTAVISDDTPATTTRPLRQRANRPGGHMFASHTTAAPSSARSSARCSHPPSPAWHTPARTSGRRRPALAQERYYIGVRRARNDRRRHVRRGGAGALLLVLRRARAADASRSRRSRPTTRRGCRSRSRSPSRWPSSRPAQPWPAGCASAAPPESPHSRLGARLACRGGRRDGHPTHHTRTRPTCTPSAFQPSQRSASRGRSSRTPGDYRLRRAAIRRPAPVTSHGPHVT